MYTLFKLELVYNIRHHASNFSELKHMIDTNKENKASIFPTRVSAKECADTGMAMVLICLLALLFTEKHSWLLAAIGVLLINMTCPKLYTLPAKGWLGLSRILGTVMSKVILSLIFFLVQTPIALLRRTLGHDPMQLGKWKNGTESVFETRDHTFQPEEIERPY